MLPKEKLSLQVKELTLQVKKSNLRIEALEKELKILKFPGFEAVKNDFLYKYCNEVDKTYIKYEKKISNSKILRRFFIFLIALYCIESLLSLRYHFPKFKMAFLISYLFVLLSAILLPFFIVFLNLKLYLKFKYLKNYFSIAIFIYKKINITFQTFFCIINFYTTTYFFARILTLSIIKDPRIDNKVSENYGLEIYLIFIMTFILTIKHPEISLKSYLQTINTKWRLYKFNVFYYMGVFIPILFVFLDAFTSEFPEINNSAQEELKKYNIACGIKFFIDILYSKLFIKYLLIAYIFHFIGHLVSEYFVDKKCIEEHNILMNKS